MTVTTQGKVYHHKAIEPLRDLCSYLCRLERKLYVDRYVHRKPLSEIKSHYIAKEGISGRHFNSIASSLEGMIRSRQEIAKLRNSSLATQIKSTEKDIQKAESKIKALSSLMKSIRAYRLKKASRPGRGTPMPSRIRGRDLDNLRGEFHAQKFTLHQKKRKLASLRYKRTKAQDESKSPRLCFGGRKLWRQQYHLGVSGFDSHHDWLREWQFKRNSHAFFLGTHSEPCRNQNAQYDPIRKILKIRMPDGLAAKWGKTIEVPVAFPYKEKELRQALTEKRKIFNIRKGQWEERFTPVSYRLVERDPGVFTVSASFDIPKAEVETSSSLGGVGIDLNGDHIAVCEADRFGNPVAAQSFPFHWQGASSGQLKAQFGDHIAVIVARAKATGKPVVCEKLDFSNKKQRLRRESLQRRQQLSSFAYKLFYEMLESRCYREGVGFHSVNPAFTSLIGHLKFKGYRRYSSHELAALAIVRRELGFSERPKTHNAPGRTESISGLGDPGRFVKETLPGHVWSYYSRYREAIKQSLLASSQGRGRFCSYSLRHPSGYHQLVKGGYVMTKARADSIVMMSKGQGRHAFA